MMPLQFFILILLSFAFIPSHSIFASEEKNSALLPTLPQKALEPEDNMGTPAKIKLGKELYMDPRLSFDGNSSCNTCHNVMAGGDDNRAVSTGINGQKGRRSSPTVWNAAFLSVQFWDGRAPNLEEQALGPLTNPVEMGNPDHGHVVATLRKIPGYVKEFNEVFGSKDALNKQNIAAAIAAFERTLITPNSPYDRYARGNKRALTPQAIKGMNLVQEVGCTSCHSGALFAGPDLPMGTGFYQKFPVYPGSPYEAKYKLTEDLGRFEVTHRESDKNMMRVPTWRNIALTAPYFHNGSVDNLEEAVRVMAKMQLNRELPSDDVTAIVAFLKSLTGEFPKITMPRLP